MCGICGVFDMKNEGRVNRGYIHKMAMKLNHRGPDVMDFFYDTNVNLGFTRLSIIDLEGGMQPITNEDNSVVLICNGEIFNYRELRIFLESRGHHFKTNSDVEVVLHYYEENDMDFLNKINGQFAFAIYDSQKNQIICARDQVGIAPFFYTVADGIFVFGSEIKAILEYPAVKKEVDLVGLDQLVTFPGIISPRTLFKNIFSLENGHYLVVREGNIRNIEYWDLIYPTMDEPNNSGNEHFYVEKLDELLTESIKYRLQADVPVGFYISGGLDSSIIASKIWKIDSTGQPRHSFSIDFTDKNISESKYQRLMADYVHSLHHEKIFHPTDILNRLPDVIYHSETALKETYNTASLLLSESVQAEKIKVVLTGEGADELFGGYVGYKFDKIRNQQPQDTPNKDKENEIRTRLWGDENFFYEKDYYAHEQQKREFYSGSILENFQAINCLNYPVVNPERIKNIDILHKRSYLDFRLRMTDHLLADHGDRMAYANSVEARYPYLDKNLIDFVRFIPPDLKLKGFNEKYILKRIAEPIIPGDIVKRPKFAFVAPGSPELLKQNNEYVNDLIAYDRIKKQGYFNPDTVEKYKKQYSQADFKLNLPFDSDFLIIVITFGMFLENFNVPDLT